jgi:hypothetical protein
MPKSVFHHQAHPIGGYPHPKQEEIKITLLPIALRKSHPTIPLAHIQKMNHLK